MERERLSADMYEVLAKGTAEERLRFARALPGPPLGDDELRLLASHDPAPFFAFVRVIHLYTTGALAGTGVQLAGALHRLGVELVEKTPDESTVRVLGVYAEALVAALRELRRFDEIVTFADRYVRFYRDHGEASTAGRLALARDDATRRSDLAGDMLSVPMPGRSEPPAHGEFETLFGTVSPPPAAPAPAAAPTPYARPPQPAKPVSTGLADRRRPGQPLSAIAPVVPGGDYYFWLEVGKVAGAIDAKPTPLPTALLPADARLTVVLFAPGDGFTLFMGEDSGEIALQPDGSAVVVLQAVHAPERADEELLARRLLFPIRAPERPGEHRLRCNIYYRGVLVQSRHVDVEVGGVRRATHVSYTLATKLDPAKLGELTEHRLSILTNHRPDGSHDFYVFGSDGASRFHQSASISVADVGSALELARAALRRASWGDEGTYSDDKQYRYDGAMDIARLREDLAVLAIAGYRIYDLLVNQLAGGARKVKALEAIVGAPGFVQVATDADLALVLPAALVYDYPLDTQAGRPASYTLCPEFERALRAGAVLSETACFKGQCPTRGQLGSVCPSGFWGFRHALGLPISDAEEEDAEDAELAVRIEYRDAPRIVVGVSRAPDLPRTRAHTAELLALRPEWKDRAWLVADQLPPLLTAMRTKDPHVVYMYCHGSGREVGATEIPMLYFGATPERAQPGEWLERATLRAQVAWTTPRPLVFLNGCRTTVLDTRTTLDFVRGFVQNANACGVVGTEITVFEPLAGEFARSFLQRFLGGAPVGMAVRDARLDLLQQGNPLGLVYTPFVLGGTRLVPVAS